MAHNPEDRVRSAAKNAARRLGGKEPTSRTVYDEKRELRKHASFFGLRKKKDAWVTVQVPRVEKTPGSEWLLRSAHSCVREELGGGSFVEDRSTVEHLLRWDGELIVRDDTWSEGIRAGNYWNSGADKRERVATKDDIHELDYDLKHKDYGNGSHHNYRGELRFADWGAGLEARLGELVHKMVTLQSDADELAPLGLGQARLAERASIMDLAAVRQAAAERPTDVQAQIDAADLEMVGGHVDDAFQRLVDAVKATSGEDRDRARTHLLSLFDTLGAVDPRVQKWRSALAGGLF